MELFILRHGHAEAEAPKDRLRELSPRGEADVSSIIKNYADELKNIKRLFVSPYIRAQQTAALVSEQLGEIAKVDLDLLVPNGAPKAVIDYLFPLFHEQNLTSLMLVGHQPLLGILVDELCGLEPGKHRLGTASLAAIDIDVMAAGCCTLRWMHHTS